MPTSNAIFYTLAYSHSRLYSLAEKPESLELNWADFDGVTYRLSTPNADNKHELRLSMSMKCYGNALVSYGAQAYMQREYGPWLASTAEPGYDVTLDLDETQLAGSGRGSSGLK